MHEAFWSQMEAAGYNTDAMKADPRCYEYGAKWAHYRVGQKVMAHGQLCTIVAKEQGGWPNLFYYKAKQGKFFEIFGDGREFSIPDLSNVSFIRRAA